LVIDTKIENFIKQIRKPELKDIELIAMNLILEYMDIECQLFREIPNSLNNKTDRSVYNRIKHKLFLATDFVNVLCIKNWK